MPHEAVELRLLDVNDAAALSLIATQAYTQHYADTWYDNGAWYLQTYFSILHVTEELNDPNARFFSICYQQQEVGFLKLNISKPLLHKETDALEIERIYLLKSVSGKGIGTFVLNVVFNMARAQNKKLIWLKVMDTNSGAVCFYQKMGFEICGVHQVHFPQKKEGLRGMYVMQKKV